MSVVAQSMNSFALRGAELPRLDEQLHADARHARTGFEKRASSAATMRSHMQASISPAAEQVPCTAAIVGLRKSRILTSLSQYMTCSWRSLPSGVRAHRGPVLLAREDLLEVVAGGEVLALGGEHHDAHVVVGVGRVERGVELVDHLASSARSRPPGGASVMVATAPSTS